MNRTRSALALLMVAAGCGRDLPPDPAALLYARHPELRGHWALHPASTHELRREIERCDQAVVGLVRSLRARYQLESNVVQHLQWVETNAQAGTSQALNELAGMEREMGAGGHLYFYELSDGSEAGHVILRNGEIVKKIPMYTSLNQDLQFRRRRAEGPRSIVRS